MSGYSIDNVLRRSNGIININVHKKDDYDGIMNDNANFTLKDGTVKLIKIYDDYGSEVVRSSSYGGVYVTSRY